MIDQFQQNQIEKDVIKNIRTRLVQLAMYEVKALAPVPPKIPNLSVADTYLALASTLRTSGNPLEDKHKKIHALKSIGETLKLLDQITGSEFTSKDNIDVIAENKVDVFVEKYPGKTRTYTTGYAEQITSHLQDLKDYCNKLNNVENGQFASRATHKIINGLLSLLRSITSVFSSSKKPEERPFTGKLRASFWNEENSLSSQYHGAVGEPSLHEVKTSKTEGLLGSALSSNPVDATLGITKEVLATECFLRTVQLR